MQKRESWILGGNTYPVRDTIRAMGGVWDPQSKTWTVGWGTMKEKASRSSIIYQLSKRGVVVR